MAYYLSALQEEILWTNKSETTASGALAEWRSARTRSGQDIVDWGRYHLQVIRCTCSS